MDIWIYLIKVSALWLLFYLSYNLLLKRETFFQANRWFLLSGLVLAPILPLISFTKTIWREPVITAISQNLVYSSKERFTEISEGVVAASTGISWLQIVFVVYLIGVVGLSIRLLWRGVSLWRMLRQSNYTVVDKFRLIDDVKIEAPFSFFQYIAYNSKTYSKMELENIIKHEKVHSQQKHSIDVLIGELLSVVFWFHPIVWAYKKVILQNLEFLADTIAIEATKDKKHYQMTLLKVTFSSQNLALTNAFYQPLIKKRIQMLNKNKSKPRNLWKLGIVVPLLFIFVIQFQAKVVAKTLPNTNLAEMESQREKGIIISHEMQKDTIIESQTKEEDLKMTKQGAVSSSVKVSWNASLDKFANKTLTGKELRDFVEKEMKEVLLGDKPFMVVDGKQGVKDTDKIALKREISVVLLTGQKAYDRYGELAADGAIIISSLTDNATVIKPETTEEVESQKQDFIDGFTKGELDENSKESLSLKEIEQQRKFNQEYVDKVIESQKEIGEYLDKSEQLTSKDSVQKEMEVLQQPMLEEQEEEAVFEEMEKQDAEALKNHEPIANQNIHGFREASTDSTNISNEENGTTISGIEIQIDKNTTEEQIEDLKARLEAEGINMQVSRIKRNTDGEIYRIHIKLIEVIQSETNKSNSVTQASIQRNKSNPIHTISVGKQDGRLFID